MFNRFGGKEHFSNWKNAFLYDASRANEANQFTLTPANGAFSFQLLSSDGTVLQTVKNEGTAITFAPLIFRQTGKFRYTLQEVQERSSTIIYDTSKYQVIVNVHKDADGNYQAELSYSRNANPYTGTPSFVNRYRTASPNTSDSFSPVLWAALLLASCFHMFLLIRRRTRV